MKSIEERAEQRNKAQALLVQKHTKLRRALYDLFHMTAPHLRGKGNEDMDGLYAEVEELLK